jgi:hypothetical protein
MPPPADRPRQSRYPGRERVARCRRIERLLDLELDVERYPNVVELYCRPVEASFAALAATP